jgi:hypothetical protein
MDILYKEERKKKRRKDDKRWTGHGLTEGHITAQHDGDGTAPDFLLVNTYTQRHVAYGIPRRRADPPQGQGEPVGRRIHEIVESSNRYQQQH